ncbi:MAG: sigma-54-dependent Fis family transcriptional regulator [Labilithrix sp.]|nr:sigma-54-dependent Fis family transcriptional regulator [Labilithrix sp.]MCW5810284.1 sigma-54-dependent Fis family transcriptional regulator [Labilithrix sp.]
MNGELSTLGRVAVLSKEGASGELICASDTIEVHVYLQRGRIAWATDAAQPLAFTRYLLERAQIDVEVFREILESCRREKRPLGETLIAWGVATREEVRDALRHQIELALARIHESGPVESLFLKRTSQFSDYDVLGETGTGKSMLARRIHALGLRSGGPFVDVNCAGLSHDFVQSELFGHERGSFTGAFATREGLLDAANGGTLFLDEIGDMDPRVQPKLLKVLEEKRFRRLGDSRDRTVDVRLIAATHRDLVGPESGFRPDLYYRISTVTLLVPPLRERAPDLDALALQMLERLSAGEDERCELTSGALDKLHEHTWPGNLRELRSVLERALIRRKGALIAADDIRFDPLRSSSPRLPPEPPSSVRTRPALLAEDAGMASRGEVEKEHIRLALAAENGRVIHAARRLGMSRSTLYSKLKRYHIDHVEVRRPLVRRRSSA